MQDLDVDRHCHTAPERLFPPDEKQAMQELKALLQSRLAAAEREGALPSAAEIADEALRETGTT